MYGREQEKTIGEWVRAKDADKTIREYYDGLFTDPPKSWPDTPPDMTLGEAMKEFKQKTSLPLDQQVGGSHYKDMGVQPFEATHANFGYEGLRAAVYCKVLKYLGRDKGTHVRDIEKAIHCLQIQLEEARKEYRDDE